MVQHANKLVHWLGARFTCRICSLATMLSAHLRLVRVACLAHLRSAGIVPWLLLAGLVGWAVLLEPAVLRRSGMPLAEPSAQLAGFLVLTTMVGDPTVRVPVAWHRWLIVSCLTLLVGFVQAGLVVGFLQVLGRAGAGSMALATWTFAACWLAPAIHVAVAGMGSSRLLLLALQVSVSSNLAVALMRGSASIGDWVAAGLCVSASLLATPRPAKERYANRYSW